MNDLNIPLAQYQQIASQFNPTQFSAAQWVQTAKDAGMQYIVLTTKHHDGFSLFDTSVNNYDSVDATPWHQDAVAQLSAATHAAGLHFGAYYSILNWADPQRQCGWGQHLHADDGDTAEGADHQRSSRHSLV